MEYIEIDGYTQREYIEVQQAGPYIDTGAPNTQSAYVEVDAQYTNTPGNNYGIFGAQAPNQEYTINCYGGVFFANFGAGRTVIPWSEVLDRHVFSVNGSGISVDDGAYTGAVNWNNVTSRNYYMFAINYSGGVLPTANCRIFECKIYDGAVMIRHFVPVTRDSDSAPGFYDLVGETFYGNSGSGALVPGAIVPPPEPPPPPPPPTGDLEIVLQYSASENNRVDKTLTDIATYSGTLRQSTSIIDPVFVVECSLPDVVGANYLTVAAFGRSYFIKNITSHRAGLVEFTCHVDVLSSFKTQLRTNRAIVHRSERNWNLYLNDGSLKTKQNPTITTQEFQESFAGALSYVLVLAG